MRKILIDEGLIFCAIEELTRDYKAAKKKSEKAEICGRINQLFAIIELADRGFAERVEDE